MRRKDGFVVWILISVSLLADETKTGMVIQGTTTDMTRRIDAQQKSRPLSDIVRCSHDAIFSITTDERIQTWNVSAERIFGYSAAEILGNSVRVLTPDDGVAETSEILRTVSSGREVKNRESIRVRKDGQRIAVEITISPITDSAGRVIGASTVARDITEKQRREVALRQSEEQYRLLFEANPVPMWIFARSTLRFLAVNNAAIEQYGYSKQEFMTMKIMDIRPEEEIPHMLRETATCPPGLQKRGFWKHRKKNLSTLDVEIVSHHLDFQGIDSVLVAAHDMTERQRAEQAVQLAEEKYRAIFENSVIGMFQGTPDGRFISVNRAFALMFGYDSTEEMLTETPKTAESRLVDPSLLAGWFQQMKEHCVVREAEVEIYRKDRTTKWVRGSLRALRDASGNIVLHEGTVQDITDRKRAEQSLLDSESRYRALFEDSADANWLIEQNRIQCCNSAALQMFGYTSADPVMTAADISPLNQPDGRLSQIARAQNLAAALLHGQERFEWLHRRKNGDTFPADVYLTALTLSGRPMLMATVRDITESNRAKESLLLKTALLEAQTEATIDGILVVDESNRIVLLNKQFGIDFGIPDELLNKRDDLLLRKYTMDQVENPAAFIEKITYLNSNRDEKSRDELRMKNGKIFERYSAPLVDARGQYRGRIWYHRDITDRKVAEQRIEFLAYHDVLTELPHRALLQDRLDHALADARRRNEKVALLFLDLDRFKAINDSFGHSLGDLALQVVAKRLKDCVREQDTVARVGGDEFLILMNSVKDAADVAITAKRIMDAMSADFIIQGHSLNVGCCIGVSMFPDHGADGGTLIKNADAAMYFAKEHGLGSVRFFTHELNVQAVERLTMDKDLQLALDRDEFFLMYQPQVEIESGRITGFEALLRWQHPQKGLIPPDTFISIAENDGLILPIGEWVLRTACAQARKWQNDGLPAVAVAVNVPAVQFRQEGFCALIRRVLEETGLSAEYLELELTESLLLSSAEATLSILQELKEMGLRLAIDDFGTGYSSFRYLKQFSIDKLKIDRSFVRDVAISCNDAAIANAIISMAKSLGLRVIAEGVENDAQMSFMREHGCDEIQGYYFSRPLSVEGAASMLRFLPCHEDCQPAISECP
jgi:diguanylate cyclase (GGDEF)-like protein/PAS domain S-box-containing protein